ncbi:cytochrome ubiquinol oxidase subunit I [Streptomyces sp. SBST2-5]|uniref:Cytochrome ubiquinol oxidase subunit I n=1 Tax=Streptomyces composti TaxID=2720025 RepID=A0ABX1A2D0_9ACTN|nr:cytochrome ubiquinol oxidase subunit I [Streptomyces composti]NJP50410.1 cytochrome ubiquinol oxidase subunit I [Streptomyces composti]
MTHTDTPEQQQEAPGFSTAQYIVPCLALVVGDTGVRRTYLAERPLLFWVFTAMVALGVLSAALQLKRLWTVHRRSPLPWWPRFLGLLLALFALYVACRTGVRMAG